MNQPTNPVPKVIAYITRHQDNTTQLLVHRHRDFPEAGLQVPAGTVEPHEPIEAALWREVAEESGLTPAQGLTLDRWLATYLLWNPWSHRWQQRHVFALTVAGPTPETWEHTITGSGEDQGIVFVYRWIPIADAATQLNGFQGDWLPA